MTGVLDEFKVEGGIEFRESAGLEKAAMSEKLEDGKAAARRLLRRGRYAIEDGASEAAHIIKHHPFSSVLVALAAGAILGFVASRPVRK